MSERHSQEDAKHTSLQGGMLGILFFSYSNLNRSSQIRFIRNMGSVDIPWGIIEYWCPLKIFGDFRDFYFLGQPIYWTHK